MIKLEKRTEPEVLSRNASNWTNEVVNRIESGQIPTPSQRRRYNHADIKTTLIAETHGKCAYCESKFRHITYGDIEHVIPKSDDPTKWFAWSNLTLACDVCNTKKSDAPIDGESFIDPYDVDPEEHFWQLGPIMHPRPGCDAAAITERLLDLNRADLVERRKERQQALLRMLDVVERCSEPELKSILWEEFILQAQAHNEYAALSRTTIEYAKRKLAVATTNVE